MTSLFPWLVVLIVFDNNSFLFLKVATVNNWFLIQLGLLKSEDKQFKPSYNLTACRSALQHAIDSKTFSDDVQQTFNLFLSQFK